MLGNQKKKTKKGRKKKQPAPMHHHTGQAESKSLAGKDQGVQPKIIVAKKTGDAAVAAAPHIFRAKLVNESVIKREGSHERVPTKSSQSIYMTYSTNPLSVT